MPPAFVPHEGGIYLNTSLLRDPAVAADDWYLRLFDNAFTPNKNSVFADFHESVFAGYSAQILSPTGWLAPVLNGDFVLSYYGPVPRLFNISAGTATIQGWYITAEASKVLWCQLLDTPFTISTVLPYAIMPIWAGESFYNP